MCSNNQDASAQPYTDELVEFLLNPQCHLTAIFRERTRTHKLGNDAAKSAKLKHTEAGHFTGAILRDDLGQNIANVYESPQKPQSS